MNNSIMGSLSEQVTLSHTIICKLPDLINNEPCKLVTEETRDDRVVYRFGPVLVDDSTDTDLAPQQKNTWDKASSTILIPLTPVDTLTTTSMENTSLSSSSTTTSSSSSSLPLSNNLLTALAPSFDPRSLDLFAASVTSDNNNNNNHSPTSRKTKYSKRKTKNSDQMDLISFENPSPSPSTTTSVPPASSVSSMSLSPSTSSSSSSHTPLQSPLPLVYYPASSSIVPPMNERAPSPTSKDPLVHHPTHSRYSKTSFYRPPPRTIVTMRRPPPPH